MYLLRVVEMHTDCTLGCLKIDDIDFGMVHERSRAREVTRPKQDRLRMDG
jgi:hypothetical protein